MDKKKIVFDSERMKYPHTGLYHFCKNLGEALLEKKPDNYSLDFYMTDSDNDVFGDNVKYYRQKSFHKIWPFFAPDANLWHSTYQLSSYLPRNRGIKVLSTIHDLNFLKEGKSVAKEEKYLKKLQDNLNRTDVVVAISSYVKQDLEDYCDLKGKPIHVIYNGNNIQPQIMNQVTVNTSLMRPFIYTIGTVNRKKNFHVLVYLLLGNSLELKISGINADTTYQQYILDLAKELGVADRVYLTGPISEQEKYNYLRDCSIFAFPSIAEGFGLPVIEAMSFGKKVLLSRYTSLPEIGGSEAFYLDAMDPEYLMEFGKDNLLEIINGADRSNEIKKWAAQFSWEKAASQYWDLYKELLK